MDSSLRLFSFIGLFLLLALLERLRPAWQQDAMYRSRWLNNFSLLVIGALVTRALFGLGLIELATWAQQNNFGLLNNTNSPAVMKGLLAYILLDMAIYWQHVASHKIPLLWRFHKVHHADTALDVSSAVRFHPIEAIISFAYKGLVVVLVGAPAIAVLCFELALNLGASFNHANIAIPKRLDQFIRLLIVTPSFHRIHHSPTPTRTNSNYGFMIIWWDYLFGSSTAITTAEDSTTVGLDNLGENIDPANIKASLVDIPFRT